MMRKRRTGVVVYSNNIPESGKVVVGAWIGRPISSKLRAELMKLNETAGLGHVGVRTTSKRTTVIYVGPAAKVETEKHRTPRQIAVSLSRAVRKVVGVWFTFCHVRNTGLVRRAVLA